MSITLLGTSHISPKSAQVVREQILSGDFAIVAIELDEQRLRQLFSKKDEPVSFFALAKAVGVGGALFAKLGHFVQKHLGGRIGMQPGEEMRSAVLAAKKANLKLALIDRPIHQTLKRFSSAFTFKEKLRLAASIFRLSRVRFDLNSVPDDALVQEMLGELKKTSPALYRVLVSERNDHMCKALQSLQKNFPNERILAVVGAGHVPGMTECLKTSSSDVSV